MVFSLQLKLQHVKNHSFSSCFFPLYGNIHKLRRDYVGASINHVTQFFYNLHPPPVELHGLLFNPLLETMVSKGSKISTNGFTIF